MKIKKHFLYIFFKSMDKTFFKKNVFYKEEIEDNLHKPLWEIIFLPCYLKEKILIAGSYRYDVR